MDKEMININANLLKEPIFVTFMKGDEEVQVVNFALSKGYGKGREYIKDWVAVIGDSTFMHTGINGLKNMVYNKGTGTVIILDNGTTAMTGHQDHASSGATLQQGEVMPISIAKLCRSLGILDVYEVDAFDTKKMKELLLEAVPRKSVTVMHRHRVY